MLKLSLIVLSGLLAASLAYNFDDTDFSKSQTNKDL